MSSEYGLPHELDGTPRWLYDNTSGSGRGYGRCNPFGYEDSQVTVMGGTRDPAREKHVWRCENWADGRFRMTCTAGHSGEMTLCYAHVYQVRKRMTGICPRCAQPPRARELEATMNRVMAAFATTPRSGWPALTGRLEDCRREMNEMIDRGQIRTGAPLRLEEVS